MPLLYNVRENEINLNGNELRHKRKGRKGMWLKYHS